MGQPDEAPRELPRGPVFAGPEPVRVAAPTATPSPTTQPAESPPLAPPTIAVDLAAVRTTGEPTTADPSTPRTAPLARPPAPLTDLDNAALLTRARDLELTSLDRTTDPLLARTALATIADIQTILRRRGAPEAEHPVFQQPAVALTEPAPGEEPAPAPLSEQPEPPAPPRRPARRRTAPRPRRRPDRAPAPPTIAEPAAAPQPELPAGAIRLDTPEADTTVLLLRHAAAAVRGNRAEFSQQFGARTVAIQAPALIDPAARRIVERFSQAFDGRGDAGRTLTTPQRLAALREGWTLLDQRVAADGPPGPAELAARESFEAAYEAQQQVLYGLAAADTARASLEIDPTLRGLNPPTLLDAYVTQQINVLTPALDDVSKAVTTLTRYQGRELNELSTKIIAGSAIGPAGADRFTFLARVTYVRALLNTIKGIIAVGDLAAPVKRSPDGKTDTTAKAVTGIIVPAKLLEGLMGGLFLTLAVIHAIRRDPAELAVTLARFSLVGRGLVWAGAFGQLFGGVANLIAVAAGSQEFKRAFLFDVGYGAAGTLAPIGSLGGAAVERSIVQEFNISYKQAADLAQKSQKALATRLETGGAETAAEVAGRRYVARVARRELLRRVAAFTGPATALVGAADIGVQIVGLGREQFEKTRVGDGLSASLGELEDFGAVVSADAIAIATALETSPRADKVDQARRLHAYMTNNLFALRYRHQTQRGDAALSTSYPALARRLVAVEQNLAGVDPSDPARVLQAARGVLAGLRRILGEGSTIYREVLGKLDADRFLLGNLHAEGLPPPKP